MCFASVEFRCLPLPTLPRKGIGLEKDDGVGVRLHILRNWVMERLLKDIPKNLHMCSKEFLVQPSQNNSTLPCSVSGKILCFFPLIHPSYSSTRKRRKKMERMVHSPVPSKPRSRQSEEDEIRGLKWTYLCF